MNAKKTLEILKVIVEAQQDCASVELSIGTTFDGMVEHGGVYIIDCPASVVNALSEAGYPMGMQDGKMYIMDLR